MGQAGGHAFTGQQVMRILGRNVAGRTGRKGAAAQAPDGGVDDRGPQIDSGQHVGVAGVAGGDQVVTSGGRVLCAVALGESVAQAQRRAYSLAEGITWKDVYSRSDIGHRAIAREQQA